MQIGRITGLTEPHDWDSTADNTVTITADYQATSVADGMFVRDQILSYPTPDEDVIPVILTSETRSTGFYRPMSSKILTDQLSRVGGKIFNYTMQLQRVPNFAFPWVESVINGALLTNAVGAVGTDVIPYHAIPVDATSEYSSSPAFANQTTRTTDDGQITFNYDSGTGSIASVARWSVSPSNYYEGAARFEQGSPLRVVVGRNLVQNDAVNWRLNNGLVRLSVDAQGHILVSHYNGSTWSGTKSYRVGAGGAFLTGINSVTVLRNSPAETIVRLSLFATGLPGVVGVVTIDFALRRGDRFVRCYLSSTVSRTWQVVRTTNEAATAITYGAVTLGAFRATANDGDGNRYILASYQAATTSDLVNGKITLNAGATTMDFALGSEVGGSGAVAPDNAVSIAKEYIAAQSEEQRIVAR